MAPAWGLSLDFVPHISGNSLKWHRTNKSARFDIHIDWRRKPWDQCRSMGWDLMYIHGPDALNKKAKRTIPRVVKRSMKFWGKFSSVESLVDAVEYMRRYYDKRRGLGFYNYAQAPLAAAIVLAKAGARVQAQAELDMYIERSRPNESCTLRLREMLSEL